MPKFFMLVGIAGCGKSTWAQKNLNHYQMFTKIFSSDIYRENLFNDINDQTHNKIVFDTMHKDIIKALKNGESVCYDATNLTRKNRQNILHLINKQNIECQKIAVLFEVEESIIREQNANRERKIPDIILDQMFRRFEIPFLDEGFDDINIVFRRENSLKAYEETVALMHNFDQKNLNHSKDLLTHCMHCYGQLIKNDDTKDNLELLTAGLLHDYGKLFTQEYDEVKDLYHYIGYANYGAYKSLFLDYTPLIVNKEKVAFYINYHMEPY